MSFSTNPIAHQAVGLRPWPSASGSNTAVGSYPITVTGNGGGVQHTTIVTLNVTTSAPHISLSWTASPSQVMGYNLYRSMASGGPYTKINTNLIPDTAYTDPAVQHGFTYYYVATASRFRPDGKHVLKRGCGYNAVVDPSPPKGQVWNGGIDQPAATRQRTGSPQPQEYAVKTRDGTGTR